MSPRVIVDATPLLERRFGIGYYVENLTRALAAPGRRLDLAGLYRYVRAGGKEFPDWMPAVSLRLPHPWADQIFGRWGLPADHIIRSDLFHATTLFLPRFSRTATVLTVYDLAFKVNPDWFPWSASDFERRLGVALRRADRVITISECTRIDLLRHYPVEPSRVRAIPLGPLHEGRPGLSSRRAGLPENYLLYVGTLEPRKNVARLVEAWTRASTPYDLVLVGAEGWKAGPIYESIARSARRDRIHLLGYVPHEEMPSLYRNAQAFLYPSLYEGFGLPVLEAMKFGTPVVTSRRSSLPEVGGEAVLYVDPDDVESLREAIERICEDEELRRKLSTQGMERSKLFSWERTAEETANVYHSLV